MSSALKIINLLIGMVLTNFLFAQTDSLALRPEFSAIKTVFQHLEGYQKMLIKTNLDSLMLNKVAGKKQDAFVITSGKNLELIKLPMKIAARGKFRRRTCDLPPIWIDFPKETLKKWGLFPEYDKLKLVTHCLLFEENRQAVLKEYWTYKMHNQLTLNSFKVHLMEVIYVHSEDPKRKYREIGFLIENSHEMAHRIGGHIVEGMGKKANLFTEKSYNNTLFFNYMIGNTDSSIELAKNLKFVQKERGNKLTLVPYDFDFSALVKPPYYKNIPIQDAENNPENRIALGKCATKEGLLATATTFADLRKTGFQCFKDCPLLDGNEKKGMRFYLQPFFKMLKKEAWLEEEFLNAK
ncbi:MAG: hypothetical protein AB8G86_06435 [Saprospiraceae bacterium]